MGILKRSAAPDASSLPFSVGAAGPAWHSSDGHPQASSQSQHPSQAHTAHARLCRRQHLADQSVLTECPPPPQKPGSLPGTPRNPLQTRQCDGPGEVPISFPSRHPLRSRRESEEAPSTR